MKHLAPLTDPVNGIMYSVCGSWKEIYMQKILFLLYHVIILIFNVNQVFWHLLNGRHSLFRKSSIELYDTF